MHRKIWLLVLLSAMLLSAESDKVHGDSYVIGRVGTKITSLPYTISQAGFYYLGGNLTYSGNPDAITITADNVTLDLMGFSLIYTGSGEPDAVHMEERKNVEVRNGTLRGFWTGVYEKSLSGANHRILNVRANYGTMEGAVGIWLSGNGHLVKGCTASNNQDVGIVVTSGTITDCVACENGDTGIQLLGPGSVIGNVVLNNSLCNFLLGKGEVTAIMVDRNSASGQTTNYVELIGTTGVQMGINAGTP